LAIRLLDVDWDERTGAMMIIAAIAVLIILGLFFSMFAAPPRAGR
jgi:hypothetical protein